MLLAFARLHHPGVARQGKGKQPAAERGAELPPRSAAGSPLQPGARGGCAARPLPARRQKVACALIRGAAVRQGGVNPRCRKGARIQLKLRRDGLAGIEDLDSLVAGWKRPRAR